MDANVSTMTMPKTMPVQNLLRYVSFKGQVISKWLFWCLQFSPKNKRKQVNLRFHSSKVEFVRSFFGGNVGWKK